MLYLTNQQSWILRAKASLSNDGRSVSGRMDDIITVRSQKQSKEKQIVRGRADLPKKAWSNVDTKTIFGYEVQSMRFSMF